MSSPGFTGPLCFLYFDTADSQRTSTGGLLHCLLSAPRVSVSLQLAGRGRAGGTVSESVTAAGSALAGPSREFDLTRHDMTGRGQSYKAGCMYDLFSRYAEFSRLISEMR